MYKEDLHLISGITEDSQSQGPPTQHLQLQAQLQCSARQPQQLPTLVSQPQVQPAPTNRDPQDSRAQPSALLYHSTMSREDLHLIDVTEDSQPQDPTPQLQRALNYLEPREDPHLITITKNTGEPSPGPSSPQRPPEPQIAGITQLLQDPERKGPLNLEPPISTLAKTDTPKEFEVRGHPTLNVSKGCEPAEEGATASTTGKDAPVTGLLADQTTDAVITSSPEVSGEHQVRGGPGVTSSV